MVNYQKLYSTIYNAVTDAIEELKEARYCKAMEILILAQQTTEEMYICADDERAGNVLKLNICNEKQTRE